MISVIGEKLKAAVPNLLGLGGLGAGGAVAPAALKPLIAGALAKYFPEGLFGREMMEFLGSPRTAGNEIVATLLTDLYARLSPQERSQVVAELTPLVLGLSAGGAGDVSKAIASTLTRVPGFAKLLQALPSDVKTGALSPDKLTTQLAKQPTTKEEFLKILGPCRPMINCCESEPVKLEVLEWRDIPDKAGTIGTVHFAKVKLDGVVQDVAVKIVREGTAERLERDFQTVIESLDRCRVSSGSACMRLLTSLARTVPSETYLPREKDNTANANWVHSGRAPAVVHELCNARLMTTQRIVGPSALSLRGSKEAPSVAREIFGFRLDLVLRNGNFNADPNAGSPILDRDSGRIVFVD